MRSRIPGIMESVFDIAYLLFDLLAGSFFLIQSHGNSLYLLFGILSLVLCFGDAFHLIPRVLRALHGSSPSIDRALGRGLQISSITMTLFYVILLEIRAQLYPELPIPAAARWLVWLTALARILICLLPQNDWCGSNDNRTLSLVRNGVFTVTGLVILLLFALAGDAFGRHMAAAIAVSFACYIPVTLLSRKKPMIGLLMIPKTCAYIRMLSLGLSLLLYPVA